MKNFPTTIFLLAILYSLLVTTNSVFAERRDLVKERGNEQIVINSPDTHAEVIYFNGNIITMDQNSSIYEAVGIKDYTIFAVGSTEHVKTFANSQTKLIDLKGKTMLPGFYDGHSHFMINSMQQNQGFDISPPPIGRVTKIQDIIDNTKEYLSKVILKKGFPVLGIGYSDIAFEQNRQLNKWDLDKISTDRPIMMLHSSMHMMAVNSYALAICNITMDTISDEMMEMFDIKDGQLTGLVKEKGIIMLKSLIKPIIQNQKLLQNGFKNYYQVGYTTAQDILLSYTMGYIFKNSQTDYRNLTSHYFPINIDAYLMISSPQGADKSWIQALKTKKDNFQIKGIKFILDGSIQGRTAFLNQEYYTLAEHDQMHYSPYEFVVNRSQTCLPPDCGIQSYRNQTLVNQIVSEVYYHGVDILVHCNGDAAADQLIEAVRYAKEKHLKTLHPHKSRIIMIHAQTVTEDQLDQMVELEINPSFFPGHIYYWGDDHKKTFLGPQRASRMNPAFSALKRNLKFTLHNDACVTPLQPYGAFEIIWAAVNRLTFSGQILGAEQRIPVEAALRAVTINAAWQAREEKYKGSIEEGKDADLIVVSADPLTIDYKDIRFIKVLQTIKDGGILYTNQDYNSNLQEIRINQDLRLRRV